MRYMLGLLLGTFLTSPVGAAVFLSVGGTLPENPPDISLAEGLTTALTLDLVNTGGDDVALGAAQVSFDVTPLPGSQGGLSLGFSEAGAPLFTGTLSTPQPLPNPSRTLTLAVGQVPPTPTGVALIGMQRKGFATLIVEALPGSSGSFEIAFSDFLPGNLLSSSHWSGPGIFGSRLAFANTGTGVTGEKLVATVTVTAAVPEISACWLALLCLGWRGAIRHGR